VIEVQTNGQTAIVTLSRPDVLNALSFELLERLAKVLSDIESSTARAVVVTGAGERAFCAGADVRELSGRSIDECRKGIALGQTVFARLERLRQPTIAAINGVALGGGLELALACTLRVAASDARLGFPEVSLGLIPTYGGTQRLVRTIGRPRAEELILTGRTVSATEALELSLVHQVSQGPVVDAALEVAAQLQQHSVVTLKLAREAIDAYGAAALSSGLDAERDLGTEAYATADAREGLSAFLAKRPPSFRDR
jgi:enoyl-CoA hydratase